MLVVTLVWAANFIVVKAAIETLPPVGFAALRFAIAGIALLALLRWREGAIGLPWRDFVALAVVGLLGFGVYQVLWTVALETISAGDSALLIAATPVMTALIAVVAGSDVLSPARLAGALVSFAGVIIVIAAGQGVHLGSSLGGDLLTLASALCWAIYTSYGAPILRRHSPLRTTTWAVVAGAAMLLVVGAPELANVTWSDVGADVWGAVLFSAILPAALANVVVFHAVRLLGPTRITAFQFLVPGFAVVLAAVFLGESIRVGQVLGGAVIVGGVAITRAGRSGVAGWFRGGSVSSGS